MSLTYYKGDTLYVPDVKDIESYLWRKYEDRDLQNELLDTLNSNLILYGNHSDILMKFRSELYLHTSPIRINTGKYYYFKTNMTVIKIPSLRYRYKCIIDVYTFEKVEDVDDIVIARPNIKTDVEKVYDCSFGDDYTICFNVDDGEMFLIAEKRNNKYIRILETME